MVQQIIRPTGLLDPILTMMPLDGQIDATIELCRDRVEKNERVLVTTLTKKTAEELSEYLLEVGLKVRYIHADIDAVERVEILRQLRAAEFDILVGINLLREGLDLPEVSLVCILDADNEGFLRNETSLVQTAGRAARHINGECVLFCDKVTDSIQALIDITEFRRGVQIAHNEKHGITPQSVVRSVQQSLSMAEEIKTVANKMNQSLVAEGEMDYNVMQVLSDLETEMHEAAAKLEFERAGHLRDQIKELKKKAGIEDKPTIPAKKKREIDYRNL
jgi:excinuclease ABC subunit B